MKPKIIIILGPTATGKSSLAVELAGLFKGEIINADSMQVYRFMDIGTAKPPQATRLSVRHHLIDIADPDEQYTAGRFLSDARQAIKEICSRGNLPLVVGGTGLYIRGLTEGLFEGPARDLAIRERLLQEATIYGSSHLHEKLQKIDPECAAATHPNNIRRVIRALEVYHVEKRPISTLQKEGAKKPPPYKALKIGLMKERPRLYADIDRRVEEMIQDGLVEETARLIEKGYNEASPAMGGLGYKESLAYIQGGRGKDGISLEEVKRLIKRDTRRYAKRQITWFKKEKHINWFNPFNPQDKRDIISLVEKFSASPL